MFQNESQGLDHESYKHELTIPVKWPSFVHFTYGLLNLAFCEGLCCSLSFGALWPYECQLEVTHCVFSTQVAVILKWQSFHISQPLQCLEACEEVKCLEANSVVIWLLIENRFSISGPAGGIINHLHHHSFTGHLHLTKSGNRLWPRNSPDPL